MMMMMMNEGLLEEMKRRTLDVMKGPIDINSRSWVDVVMKMRESPKEWDALPSLAWINQVIFKLKMDKEKKEKEDKERKEKEERQKKEKEDKERKEKEEKENLKRQWDGLPNTALLNIFCNTELKDRLQSIPLVCKSWKTVTDDDPRCWSSMIPDSVSPEDAFIKKTTYPCRFKSYGRIPMYYDTYEKSRDYHYLDAVSLLFNEEEEEEVVPVGVSRLRTLIKKSGGGAAITTLYLEPFTPYCQLCYELDENDDETYDEILLLIANCCPNLKHISFTVYPNTSMEAVLLLLNKCKKLELIELFYNRQIGFDDGRQEYLKLLELLSCLPDLHGLYFFNNNCGFEAVSTAIVTHLPRLKLLHLDCRPLNDEHLSIILLSCLELQYLYVTVDDYLLYLNQDIINQASVQIPEFYYQSYRFETQSDCGNSFVSDVYSHNRFVEDHGSKETANAFRVDDNFHIDDYRHILKKRKEDQYVSLLKEKIKRKKKNQCNSSLKKKKKTNSTSKKNKKYHCAYSDYVYMQIMLFNENDD